MSSHEQLETAWRSIDDRTRGERIKRIVWLAEFECLPSAIMERIETLHLLHEAREVFIHGHYAAALLLAVAVIEHSLVEELQIRGVITGSPPLSQVLLKAEENSVLPSEWFPPIRRLVLLRNPFAHLKCADHEYGLGARVISEREHPSCLVERDAQAAIKYMYEVFRATLRVAA